MERGGEGELKDHLGASRSWPEWEIRAGEEVAAERSKKKSQQLRVRRKEMREENDSAAVKVSTHCRSDRWAWRFDRWLAVRPLDRAVRPANARTDNRLF